MQKNNNKMPLTSSKVAKKAKKMGTPSPPKKKKVNEQKNADGPSKVLTTKAKGPAKKIAVVAKKGTVVKKELKVAVIKKKSTPTKIPVQSSKIIATKVIKKPTAKKVTKPKVKKVTLNTTKTELQTDTKSSEKSEETDAVIPKAKKLKKSSPDEQSNQTDSAKSTAKKPQNSKLSKKPIDLDPAVKQTLPSVVVTEVTKDTASKPATKKLTNTEKKVSAIVEKDKTVETVKVEQKSKLTPKKKVVAKVINKIVKSPQVLKKIKVKKEVVKRQTSPIKMEPVDTQIIDKIKIEEPPIKEVVEPEKKPPKKEEKSIESEKLPEKKQIKPKEISEINDKETKETIAKLLKEVNKTILKEPAKKKREMLKAKTSPNNVIIKKSKLSKPKPKKQDQTIITVKTELAEIKDETTPKKIIKKVVKPKKKAVIKTEEETEPKKEQPKINKPEKEIEEIKEKIAEEEQNTNTDDSTTSDEITLNLLRQTPTNTSSVSEEAEQSLKKTDEVLSVKPKIKKKIKSELSSDNEKKTKPLKQIKKTAVKKIQQKKKMLLLKNKMRKITKERKRSTSTDTEQKGRKLKLYSWWTGPKRHRVASLNALAKVHCLYENESRGALYDVIKRSPAPKESNSEPELDRETAVESPVEPSTRTLRSVPGLRGVGKHWDMHDDTSSSSSCEEVSNDSSVEEPKRKLLTPPPSYKQKQRETIEKKPEEKEKKKTVRKRRNRTELIMDLKDMVVRKRMASLNASAILAASYSVEKKPFRSPKSETSESEESEELFDSETEKEYKKKCYDPDVKKEESDRKVIEVRASPNKKVAVILNQDTDVTITGVYVNSTTRSTHHEGYCSIAGMQYRISATSHTQTAATAVATETLLHTAGEHGPTEQPCKSYTPLGALSNMQPPGSHAHTHPHPHPHGVHVPPPSVSPSGRRHGCTSAFAAPPASQYGPPPHHHHHGPHPPPPPPQAHVGETQQPPTYIHGYYQPAGPLITAHHGHSHPPPAPTGKSAPLPTLEASPSPTPPPTTHQPPPSSTGTAESSDNEVIITSTSSGSAEQVPVALPPPAQTYRYSTSQYPPAPGGTHAAPPGYSYSYPPSQYYHSAPSGFAQQQHYHHDICYPSSAYPPSYLHPKAYATTFRRYLPPPPPAGPQYYAGNPELYSAPPSTGQSSQVVTASSGAGGSNYQPPPTGPPPPTLVESYAPPPPPVPPTIVEPYPPPHYYTTSYGSGPAPPCYSHSPTRNLAFIDPAYQSCPCPMQSCPKNVLTGPLTGDGKRSNAIAKESMPLPPVALALPLEPASVAGPPSPARGSAGMPPPPSPAGATYQPTPTGPTSVTPTKWDAKQETTETLIDCKTTTTIEKRGKARLGKTMVRNNINNNLKTPTNQGMLLMCHNQTSSQPPQTTDVVSNVKREVESPEELQVPIAAPESVEPAVTQQKHERIPEIEKSSLSEEETNQSTDPKTETEVQSNITDECSKKLNLDDVNQNFITEDCKEQCVPVVQNGPIKTKSTIEEDTQIPQPKNEIKDEIDTTIKTVNNNLERTCTKRKLSIEETPEIVENDYEVDAKKQKTNPKTKVVNGSYKDLIKKANNNNKCIKINNGKRKLNIDSEIKPATTETKVMTCKTPKIMLGKNRKTTKRKNNTTTKEEPATKKLKTSKPLAERNLHSSKQNVKLKEKLPQTHSDLTENKEPVTKKTIQKKNNVNSKSNSTLNNVDRIIESVVLNSAYVEEPVRTSVKQESVLKQVIDKQNNVTELKPTDSAPKQNSVVHRITSKAAKIGCGRSGAHKRKSKDKCNPVPLPVPRIPRRSLNIPRWSNGWSWEGDSFQGKVFINSDEPLVVRKCYASMRHQEGDIISPRDCVLLKAGPRKIDLPFVAKVAALWEDEDGEMMMSLLWYYRPEHTDQGRRPIDQPDEVFASRHKDTNSVACIEDKCYVLTFNEYCRYRKNVRRLEEGMEPIDQVVPLPEGGAYYREHRQPPAPLVTSPDLVFFCRQVYDFRQKRLVKNPS